MIVTFFDMKKRFFFILLIQYEKIKNNGVRNITPNPLCILHKSFHYFYQIRVIVQYVAEDVQIFAEAIDFVDDRLTGMVLHRHSKTNDCREREHQRAR